MSFFVITSLIVSSCKKFDLEDNANTFFNVKINGAELPVWIKGNTKSKKMIIYINGGPGGTSLGDAKADIFKWSEKLEKSFAMVYYDQRGTGNAQGNFDEGTLTIDQYVKDLDAIITILKTKYDNPEVFLIGHSFGSFIGVSYLLYQNFEKKIAGWISIDGAYFMDQSLYWQYRRTFLINIANEEIAKGNNVAEWQEALDWANNNLAINTGEQENKFMNYLYLTDPTKSVMNKEDKLKSKSFKQILSILFTSSYNSLPAYASFHYNVVSDKLRKDAEGKNFVSTVSSLTLPAMFIWGKYDWNVPPEIGQEVFNNMGTNSSDKFFKLMPNSSHVPYLSDPEVLQNEITDFVTKY